MVKDIKYLGLTLLSGKRFKVSFESAKCKFYSAFNSLYSKLGHISDISVTLHWLENIALPTLLYAIEALDLTKSELNILDFTVNRAAC